MAIEKYIEQLEQKNYAARRAYKSTIDQFFAGDHNINLDEFPETAALAEECTEMVTNSDEMDKIPLHLKETVRVLVRSSLIIGMVVGDQANDTQRT